MDDQEHGDVGGDAAQVEFEVMTRIHSLSLQQLQGLWDELGRPAIADIRNRQNKPYIVKKLMVYLMSDAVQGEEDEGTAIMLRIRDFMNQHAPIEPVLDNVAVEADHPVQQPPVQQPPVQQPPGHPRPVVEIKREDVVNPMLGALGGGGGVAAGGLGGLSVAE